MAIPKFITERLTIREMKFKDIFGHTELFSDKETMQLFGGAPLSDNLRLTDIIESKKKDFENGASLFWVITLTEEKEFLGFIRIMCYKSYYFDKSFSILGEARNGKEFLKYIDRDGWEIDYALLKIYRNKGIMNEALNEILNYCKSQNYCPLYAKVNSTKNIATINLLKKNFFNEFMPLGNQDGQMGMIYKLNT